MTDLKLVKTNRQPADELADVREKIKTLKEREDILRTRLLAGECSLVGDEFEVIISKTKSEKIDTAALKRELGLAALRPYMAQAETTFVKLRKRK